VKEQSISAHVLFARPRYEVANPTPNCGKSGYNTSRFSMIEVHCGPGKNKESMGMAPAKILIADDNLQNVELLEAYLSDVDCTIQTAEDGEQTLQRVREDQPDLILLDIMMPKISGFEVCRKLKNDEKTHDIQILMITALNQVGDIERAVQAGTDDFLIKPVNKLEMVLRVKSLLRVRKLKNELDRVLEYLNEVEQAGRQVGTAD
jgi:CheY-like chemotaxis protein